MALVISGCHMMNGIANFGSPVDVRTTPEGKVIILDTPKTWSFFRDVTDHRIENEKLGVPVQATDPSWNCFWIDQISRLREGGWEHSGKYVSYIVEKRVETGLPPLKERDCDDTPVNSP